MKPRRPASFTDQQRDVQRALQGLETQFGDLREAKGAVELGRQEIAPKIERGPRAPSIIPTEHAEQVAVCQWWMHACKLYKVPKYVLYSVPNGANREGRINAQGVRYNPLTDWLKAEGMRNGAPDLVLDVARYPYYGLRLELKRTKGGVQSDEQKAFEEYYATTDFCYKLCRGADEAISVIKAYLG